MRLPSGENSTDVILSVCNSGGLQTISPVSTSQMRMLLSSDPETIRLQSGEYAAQLTGSVCPVSTVRRAGQSACLLVSTDSVLGSRGRYCFAIVDNFGVNGSADR
jgi:hypothetical protein